MATILEKQQGLTMLNNRTTLGGVLAAVVASATTALGQVPGLPVLQNAFANPGLAAAANFGAGGGQSFYGLAGAWGLGSGRLQISGAAGAQNSNDATRGVYGGRASLGVWTSSGGGIGVAAFGGIGGGPRTRNEVTTTNPAALMIPVGVTVGYRRAIGATRGISAYASPFYRWTRLTADDSSSRSGDIRVSVGVDFGITSSLGATLGTEFGAGGSGGGASTGNFGLGVSWVPGGGREGRR